MAGSQSGHRCNACSLQGHRVETCGTQAAAVIRRLRFQLRAERSQRLPEGQRPYKRPRKDGSAGKQARAAYTGVAEKQVRGVQHSSLPWSTSAKLGLLGRSLD